MNDVNEWCLLCGQERDQDGELPILIPLDDESVVVHRSCHNNVMNDPTVG